MKINVKNLQHYFISNIDLVKRSHKCGCVSCYDIFSPKEITDWDDYGATAICPVCGCKTVICDKVGLEITKENLKKLKTTLVGYDED